MEIFVFERENKESWLGQKTRINEESAKRSPFLKINFSKIKFNKFFSKFMERCTLYLFNYLVKIIISLILVWVALRKTFKFLCRIFNWRFEGQICTEEQFFKRLLILIGIKKDLQFWNINSILLVLLFLHLYDFIYYIVDSLLHNLTLSALKLVMQLKQLKVQKKH